MNGSGGKWKGYDPGKPSVGSMQPFGIEN